MATKDSPTRHPWRFFRAGGVDQVRIDTGADLSLDQLDQKLWVALSCPTKGLHFDERTLDLLDTDKDGRVRAPEIIGAVQWLRGCLKDPADSWRARRAACSRRSTTGTPEGRRVLESARHILRASGRRRRSRSRSTTPPRPRRSSPRRGFNGDGVVPPDSAATPRPGRSLEEIVACLGGAPTAAGSRASTRAGGQLLRRGEAYAGWYAKARGRPDASWPLGEAHGGGLRDLRGPREDRRLLPALPARGVRLPAPWRP